MSLGPKKKEKKKRKKSLYLAISPRSHTCLLGEERRQLINLDREERCAGPEPFVEMILEKLIAENSAAPKTRELG